MEFHLSKQKKLPPKKKRFNPHQYWTILLGVCILLISLELFGVSWFFVETTRELDAPANPTLETNASKIKSLNRRLDQVGQAIEKRTEREE
jgi:hypothetical protein